jgi:hypothetical protein
MLRVREAMVQARVRSIVPSAIPARVRGSRVVSSMAVSIRAPT